MNQFGKQMGFTIQIIVIILLVLPLPKGIDGLFCYRCLSLDCESPKEAECEGVREFVIKELRNYYHIENYLPECPNIKDSQKWYVLQADESPCPGMGNSPTCTAGRMQIKSHDGSGNEKASFVSHATILGCAKVGLLNSIKNAKNDAKCFEVITNGTSHNAFRLQHTLTLEHCSDLPTVCHAKDFCVDHFQSVVKPFYNTKQSAKFDYGLVIGIAAFVVVVFAAIIGASMFSFPLNRPSNLPKSTDDQADLVAIRAQRQNLRPIPRSSQSSIEEESRGTLT